MESWRTHFGLVMFELNHFNFFVNFWGRLLHQILWCNLIGTLSVLTLDNLGERDQLHDNTKFGSTKI